jgi:hypothetical protein
MRPHRQAVGASMESRMGTSVCFQAYRRSNELTQRIAT